jgi:hypothetical protein
MRPLRPGGSGGHSPARRRRGQLGVPEPTLKCPGRRQGILGELVTQHHADQAGPPGGMLTSQIEGGLDQRISGLGRRRPAPVVRRGQRKRLATPEAVEQMPDRPRGQVEGLGNGGAVLTILVATPDRLTDRHGD